MERKTSKLRVALVGLLLLAALATTANSQEEQKTIDLNALAARGEALANEDPLALELRNLQPDDAYRRGFDIGMAAAEGQTLPGTGKQRLHDSLPQDQQQGFAIAVSFSLERNKNAKFAAIGAKIAQADPAVAEARNGEPDHPRDRVGRGLVFYRLGFDIATGIFGNPALGAKGNSATGKGSIEIRDSLSSAGQRGFEASAKFNLNRRGFPPPVFPESSSPTPEGRPRAPGEMTRSDNFGKRSPALDQMIEGGWKAPETLSNEIRCRGYSRVGGSEYVFFTINSRPNSSGETIMTFDLAYTPSLKAAGPRGEGLRPGECSWADRPIGDNNAVRIRFDTPANAQLRQQLHGTPVDTSPTAAERYPDAQSIPAYLKDDNHYWSFFVQNTNRNSGYFEASGNKYWKPSASNESNDFKRRKVRNHALIPGKPE